MAVLVLLGIASFVMALTALIQIGNLRRELGILRRRQNVLVEPPRPVPAVVPVPLPVAASVPVPPSPPPPPPVPVRTPSPELPPESVATSTGSGIEALMGVKAAAFAGAVLLVMGVVFLVGYAVQHGWIGPGLRVLFGLLAGGALAVGGCAFELRGGGKYGVLARVLAGAGGALFYFTVFAAYGMYHLIGPVVAGVGLCVSALAVFGMAAFCNAQPVGVLSVLGAFLTPLLIGGEMEQGSFPLVYIAVVNLPVVVLGVRRCWRALYNTAFVLTVIRFGAWLSAGLDADAAPVALLFALIFFSECAAVNLLRLNCAPSEHGRHADTARLLAASFLLLLAVHRILSLAGWNDWMGAAFGLLALLHFTLAAWVQRRVGFFSEEVLAFVGGGLLFAALALPAQWDGGWVSLGWAVQGAVLAWVAVRLQSRTLLAVAPLLGMAGILKALGAILLSNADSSGWLFLNVRFAVGLISCGLLALQGRLAGRFPSATAPVGRDVLWWLAILASLVTASTDAFQTLGLTSDGAWIVLSGLLLAAGLALRMAMRGDSSLRLLGWMLLLLLPAQIGFFYFLRLVGMGGSAWKAFQNPAPWLMLTALAAMSFGVRTRLGAGGSSDPLPADRCALVLNLSALLAALWVLTLETGRLSGAWGGSLITVLWAVCALALTLGGLVRRAAPYRRFGLILFGLTTLKVLLVDSSVLHGMARIAAFLATGVLLLVLSFIYQRVATRFLSAEPIRK